MASWLWLPAPPWYPGPGRGLAGPESMRSQGICLRGRGSRLLGLPGTACSLATAPPFVGLHFSLGPSLPINASSGCFWLLAPAPCPPPPPCGSPSDFSHCLPLGLLLFVSPACVWPLDWSCPPMNGLPAASGSLPPPGLVPSLRVRLPLALWIHPAGFCLAVCPPPYICTCDQSSIWLSTSRPLPACPANPPTHPSSLYALGVSAPAPTPRP